MKPEKPWQEQKCDWAGRVWEPGNEPKGADTKHYFVRVNPLIENPAWYDVAGQKWSAPYREKGWTRVCNRCWRGDDLPMCSAQVHHSNHPGYSWCDKPAKVWEEGKGYCGTHNPELARQRTAAWNAKYAAEQAEFKLREDRRKARERIIADALEWRRWHFTETPCIDACEHLECRLARSVDALKELE